MHIPSIPNGILRHSPSGFVSLAHVHPLRAWALLTVELLVLLSLAWHRARGYEMPRHLEKKPEVVTGGRAFVGLLWLSILVLIITVSGHRGIVALLGDTIFIVLASLIILEWYAWWELPRWAGKLAELIVLVVYLGLAWRIAQLASPHVAWYLLVASISATVYFFAVEALSNPLRQIVVRNVLPPFVITALLVPRFVPSTQMPTIPTWLLAVSLYFLFSWLAVVLGGIWLKLPETVASSVAPMWFAVEFLLHRLGVPGFSE